MSLHALEPSLTSAAGCLSLCALCAFAMAPVHLESIHVGMLCLVAHTVYLHDCVQTCVGGIYALHHD